MVQLHRLSSDKISRWPRMGGRYKSGKRRTWAILGTSLEKLGTTTRILLQNSRYPWDSNHISSEYGLILKKVRWHIFCSNVIDSVNVILNRDIAGVIATGYGLDGRGIGVQVPIGERLFSSPRRPHRLSDPHSFVSNEYRGIFTRAKRPRREAHHSPSTSAKVKNTFFYIFTYPIHFHVVVLN
jgi:hypothetical protein